MTGSRAGVSQSQPHGPVVLRRSLRRGITAAVGGMLIVFCTPVAVLGDNGGQQIKLNAADMAAARRSVIELGHFDGAPGWKGGPKKPNLSSPTPSCPKYNYHPKQSDLVVTGAAESVFRGQGVYFDSAAEVLQDQVMVSNDFVRSVWAPGSLRCLGHYFAKGLRPGQRLLSFRRIRFPRVAQFVAEFRA